uniref:Uncharacterized protein n=1 Tax=Rhizophora mucronata TaxID=61149 RepID=A0A2P2NPQ4_RHIMU
MCHKTRNSDQNLVSATIFHYFLNTCLASST